MIQSKTFFNYSPGSSNDGAFTPAQDNENDLNNKKNLENEANKDGEKKTFKEKVHDALQEWSNDDQQDQEFDDTRP